MKKLVLVLGLVTLCAASAAQAATFELFYNATPSNTGPTGNTVLRLSSPNAGVDPYGYLRYKPTTPFALNLLNTLSADFNMVQGPFAGGSPRFDIGLDFDNDGDFDWTGGDRLLMANWGTQPWGGGAPVGWSSTGNFMDPLQGITFFDGNTQYTVAALKAMFGTLNVMRAYVSLDSGWTGNTQILDVDNFRINGDSYSLTPVPEPTVLGLLGLGLVAIARRVRTRA